MIKRNQNRITKDSTVEEVMMQLGLGDPEKLRESPQRQTTLEKFAQLRSRNPKTTLELRDERTAFVQVEEDVEEFENIVVTSRKFEQEITDLPEKYHDYIAQRAFTVHEIGHILYSDYPALKDILDKCKEDEMQKEGVDEKRAERYQNMLKYLFNVLEDGAIEKFLSEAFRVGEELAHLRATIHEDQYFGREVDMENEEGYPHDIQYQYPLFFAIIVAAMKHAVYDNGELDKLLDESNEKFIFAKRGRETDRQLFVDNCLPLIENYTPQILNEENAEMRTEIVYHLWKDLRPYLNRSITSGIEELQEKQDSSEGDSYAKGVPENLSPGHGEQGKKPITVPTEDGNNEEQNFGEEQRDRAKVGQQNEEGGSDLEDKAKEGVIDEAKRESGDWTEEMQEIIDALGAGDGIEELMVAEDGEVSHERKKKAEMRGNQTARLFARRLKRLKKDKTIRNKEYGNFDSRAMIPASRGSTRCFTQTKKGKERNYRCMIVLDRSGSMSGHIEEVELVAGSVAWGLEDNGIDVSILDTESNQTTLSKPFGVETEQFEKKIFSGRCSGGTPLTGTVKFARQRMDRGSGEIPFMIIVTDGKPSSRSKFKEQVRKANFPVLGLYITDNKEGVKEQLALYDGTVTVESDGNINQSLKHLIRKIAF